MSEAKKFSSAAVLAILLAVGAVPSAKAQRILDAPRAAGTVGERYDGFAVVHGSASSDVSALVDSVNARRRQIYEQRAQAQHAPASEIGKVYATEILRRAPAGTWFLSESGQWSQKK
jgi:uncharacterized protein YdbL (DUF1318 family)